MIYMCALFNKHQQTLPASSGTLYTKFLQHLLSNARRLLNFGADLMRTLDGR